MYKNMKAKLYKLLENIILENKCITEIQKRILKQNKKTMKEELINWTPLNLIIKDHERRVFINGTLNSKLLFFKRYHEE